MVGTLITDQQVLFEGLVEHNRLAAGTFRPQTGWHALFSKTFRHEKCWCLRHGASFFLEASGVLSPCKKATRETEITELVPWQSDLSELPTIIKK
jgi:hypothetical protein